jgi:ubiquinone/menaquinone biosynthesis C-methylase UbiE
MTTDFIGGFVSKITQQFPSDRVILNAGSGGTTYPTEATIFHLDIAENTLKDLENAFVGNIIDMPFSKHQFSDIICVGTVLNYCEAEKAIQELNRVLQIGGSLILEYERSGSGFVMKGFRNTESVLFHHTYYGEPHMNLLYSEKFVDALLMKNGFKVLERHRFNTTIPLAERFFSDEFAHKITFLESALRNTPFVNRYSHNIILKCVKTGDVLSEMTDLYLPKIENQEVVLSR